MLMKRHVDVVLHIFFLHVVDVVTRVLLHDAHHVFLWRHSYLHPRQQARVLQDLVVVFVFVEVHHLPIFLGVLLYHVGLRNVESGFSCLQVQSVVKAV